MELYSVLLHFEREKEGLPHEEEEKGEGKIDIRSRGIGVQDNDRHIRS